MAQITRLIIIVLKMFLLVYMIEETFLYNESKEWTESMVHYWSTFGFFVVVEYFADKYLLDIKYIEISCIYIRIFIKTYKFIKIIIYYIPIKFIKTRYNKMLYTIIFIIYMV